MTSSAGLRKPPCYIWLETQISAVALDGRHVTDRLPSLSRGAAGYVGSRRSEVGVYAARGLCRGSRRGQCPRYIACIGIAVWMRVEIAMTIELAVTLKNVADSRHRCGASAILAAQR